MGALAKMLVVDDGLELRKAIHDQFVEEGMEVDMAEDGDVALEMARVKEYDIVLLDFKMPRMDGKAVLAEMRKISHYPRVIMLTVIDDLETVRECIKLGAVDYITKPYDPEDLLHTVIRVLST
jgi:DNA-binding response OmpR family regulator